MGFFKKRGTRDLQDEFSYRRDSKKPFNWQAPGQAPIIPTTHHQDKSYRSPQSSRVIQPELIVPEFREFNLDQDEPSEQGSIPTGLKPATNRVFYTKCNLIVLAVENTAKVREYKNEIQRLIKKIIDDNKSALFMFLRLGNNCKYFDVLHVEKLENENLPDILFDFEPSFSEDVNLINALEHICEFTKSSSGLFSYFKCGNTTYMIEDVRIIFIGTGDNIDNKSNVNRLITILCEAKNTKAIKYFCTKDQDAIKVAENGFPVIGHIESNFYK